MKIAELRDAHEMEYDPVSDRISDIIADTISSAEFQSGLSVALEWATEMRQNICGDVARATGEDLGDIEHLDAVITALEALRVHKRPAMPTLEQVMDAMIGFVHELRNETATTG